MNHEQSIRIIGSKNPEARYEFFEKKSVTQIKKEYPVEISLPPGTPPQKIVEYIDALKATQRLRIKEDLIPESWKERAKGKKQTQSEFFNHGPYRLMQAYRANPAALVRHHFSKIEEPYAQYALEGNDGRKIFFRVIDILIADWIYRESELIDEPIKINGSKREFSCELLSRGIREREKRGEAKTHKFVIRGVPVEDDLISWKDIESSHRCEYKDNNFFCHYRETALDGHDMAVLWLLKDIKKIGMKYDIVPRPNENGRDLFMKINDQVINNGRNLTNTEQDIKVQWKMINDKQESIFA